MEQTLRQYVPKRVLNYLQGVEQPQTEPHIEYFDAVALFTDITGFSRLTDQYDQKGPEGAELLADILNAYFGRMTDVAMAYGGDVVDFVGDAIVVVWPYDDAPEDVIDRAIQCGLDLQSTLTEVAETTGLPMEQRISINAGELSLSFVGGKGDRWHWLVAGQPMADAGASYQEAAPGEVLVCAPAWERVKDRYDARVGETGNAVIPADQASEQTTSIATENNIPATQRGMAFLPAVARRLISGEVKNWIGEFRSITTLFVRFQDINLDNPDGLERLQQAVDAVQTQLNEYGGSFERLSMDDKGITALTAFGLPFMAHEDDAVRALRAAMAIQSNLQQLSMGSSIGISRGRMFCGDCGGASRRHFTRVGDSVVLAARLMTAGDGTIYCDGDTMQRAHRDIQFSDSVSLQVKGKAEAVFAYAPIRHVQRETPEYSDAMVDRTEERRRLSEALKQLVGGEDACLIISGEAGIGKSRLLAETVALAQGRGVQVLKCTGTAIDSGTQYFPWRKVLMQVLLGDEDFHADKAQSELERLLADDVRLYQWIPLLNDILPLEATENEITREITGPARASSLHILITELLRQFVALRPTLLVADDLHWFDEASANLIAGLMAGDLGEPLFILAGTRPAEQAAETVTGLLNQYSVQTLRLDALPQENMAEFIAQKLDVRLIPEQLADFVHERTGGHALFSEELLIALQSNGLIEIRGERCCLSDKFAGTDLAALPDTLKGVIVSHIDRLQPEVQHLLKTASILDHGFSLEMLKELASGIRDMAEAVSISVTEGFLVEIPGQAQIFRFRHAILRDVIYGLLPFAQRRTMHGQVAGWIEQRPETKLELQSAELATHWEVAGEAGKAVVYLEQAAVYALKQNSNREAIQHLKRAQNLYRQASLPCDQDKEAELEMLLGRAYVRLCDYASSDRHFLRCAKLLGWPMPTSRLRVVWGLTGLLVWHLLIRLGMTHYSRSEKQRIRDAYLANAYVGMAESAYFNSRILNLIYQQLLSVNYAERAQSVYETVVGLVSLATGFLQSGAYRLSAYYNRLSLSVAEKSGDSPSLGFALLLNAVNANTRGDWDYVKECAEMGLEVYNRIGDEFRWHQTASNFYHMYYLRGEFKKSEASIQECASRSSIRSLRELRFWLRCVELDIQLARGKPKRSLLQLLKDEETDAIALVGRFRRLGLIALALWRLGDREEALSVADSAYVMMQENPPAPWYTTDAFVGLAEVYIEACEFLAADNPKDPLWAKAGKVCRALQVYARGAPSSKGRIVIVNGRYQALRGKTAKAIRLWQSALELADKLDNRFDRALALHELGKQDIPNADQYRNEAWQILSEMGAAYYLSEYPETDTGQATMRKMEDVA